MIESERFELPSNPALYVDLRASWTWGMAKAMEKARASAPSETEGAVAFADVLLTKIIVNWNLKDGDGNALNVSQANIDEYLDGNDAQAIIQKAVEMRTPAMLKTTDPNSSTV